MFPNNMKDICENCDSGLPKNVSCDVNWDEYFSPWSSLQEYEYENSCLSCDPDFIKNELGNLVESETLQRKWILEAEFIAPDTLPEDIDEDLFLKWSKFMFETDIIS